MQLLQFAAAPADKQEIRALVRQVKRGMIESFGQDTEVVRRWTAINLTAVLPGAEDVTTTFLPHDAL